jgi:DNA-binding MarR family transcriptional regulator
MKSSPLRIFRAEGKWPAHVWADMTPIPDAFINKSARLSNQARVFYIALRYIAMFDQDKPADDRIRELTGFSTDAMTKAIIELESTGWIERKGGGDLYV